MKSSTGKSKAYTRADAAEMQRRVHEVIQLTLKGYSRASLLTELSNAWGVTPATVRVVIDKANIELKEIYKIRNEDLSEVINAHFWNLYKLAMEKKDYYLCRLCLFDLAKLGGIGSESNANSNVTVTFSRDAGPKKETNKVPNDSDNGSNN